VLSALTERHKLKGKKMKESTRDQQRRNFFNERAEQWLDMWYRDEETGTYTRYEKEFRRLFSITGLAEGEQVMDVGCGSGVLVPYILDAIGSGGLLLEVDYAEEMIEVNRKLHADSRVRFCACSIDRLDPEPGVYDKVICFSCFPHFEDKTAALQVMYKALKPGGRLVVAHFDSSRDLNDHHRKHESVRHDMLPAESEMRGLLAHAGMDIEDFTDEPGFYCVLALKPE
jgi:demethylmenaquinone methyltransferase/2-methoxy-6-polyprenyl-1,4-benzoquinol methylase